MSEPDEASSEEKIKVGKLNLVDLAGSERQGKTGQLSNLCVDIDSGAIMQLD